MIALKKIYGDELLRLALVLSLLKVDPNYYLEGETQQLLASLHISNGSDWSPEQEARTLIRPRYHHPKSLDNILVNYEREIFEELNSLGRYANSFVNNERIWNNRGPIHTYLVNNVATDTVVPALADNTEASDSRDQDAVSADDNVAHEVKVEEEPQRDDEEPVLPQPDAVVTLSADFLSNHTESDIFAEITTRSFDVNDFLVQPNEMQFKKDPDDPSDVDYDVRVKKERDDDDLYSDNAIDDFVPYFADRSAKLETESVFEQNMADLQDYSELFDDIKELDLDVKQQQENLEQYLLENTPLETEVYELAPMFDDELVLDVKRERASTSFTSASSSGVSEMDIGSEIDIKLEPDECQPSGDELTQEDMDLIEVLWKQDVDMGFALPSDSLQPDGPLATKVDLDDKFEGNPPKPDTSTEVEEPLKQIEELQKKHEEEGIEKVKASLLDIDSKKDDLWAGLRYTIDTETGEYLLQGDLPGDLASEEPRFDFLDEALRLVELTDDAETKDEDPEAVGESSSGEADKMLHPAMRHVPHHPLAHYHNQSLMRSMSMEQRWQDLASLLPIPPPPPPEHYQHYHHQHAHHNISGHGAAGYAPNYHHTPLAAMPEKHHEPYGAAAPLDGAYKVESAHQPQQHDAIYYQNPPGEMAAPTNNDGFLQSILDEDLQLMDMAMNEGMYTMRMLDSAGAHHAPAHHNHTHMMMQERDSASDSAVSSMGSERVPSLSDGEWCDGNDSAQEYHSSKFRPYDSSFGRDRGAPHQPQKKHHMFGKRCFQEQSPPALEPLNPGRAPVKYECPEQPYHHDPMQVQNAEYGGRAQIPVPHSVPPSHPAHPSLPAAPTHAAHPAPLDLNHVHAHALLQSSIPSPASNPARFGYCGGGGGGGGVERVRHNHTYSAPLTDHRPHVAAGRDKRARRLTESGSVSDGGSTASGGHHLSRDEKRAKALGVPLEVHDIINLPMDEFNERLSKHDLSEAQLSLIRDIRRRGKNKVAAQNCRKRKLDQITSLADEVRTVRDRKQRVLRDHHTVLAERQRLKERFAALYRHVFQSLRDPEGRPLSSSQFSLQQAADGNVVLVPKMSSPSDNLMNRTSDDDLDRKKHYEQ